MFPLLLFALPAISAEVEARCREVVLPGQQPMLYVRAPNHPVAMLAECTLGEKTLQWEVPALAAGREQALELPRDEKITSASCAVRAVFANGYFEGTEAQLEWRYQDEAEQEPATGTMDYLAKKATLQVPFALRGLQVAAVDEQGAELFRQDLPMTGGPGKVSFGWSASAEQTPVSVKFTLLGEGEKRSEVRLAVPRQ